MNTTARPQKGGVGEEQRRRQQSFLKELLWAVKISENR
jgi:hypothetical protein